VHALRRERVREELVRARRARAARVEAHDDLEYRRLSAQALAAEKERLRLEHSTREEARRAAAAARRRRHEALDTFYADQLEMLHGELAREEAGLALRERASHSLELSIDAEARREQRALLRQLHDRRGASRLA